MSRQFDRTKKKLIPALGLLVLGQAYMNSAQVYPEWSQKHSPVKAGKDLVSGALSADQMLFALAGFRELIAGILWVRADSFFETGNYDAILPLVRVVTLLDPRQLDVYATGMWHIGYNFTDEDQRSDRRYLPSALGLGKEGSENNPDTYEMFFESGWMWYHKIDDGFDRAVKWLEEANKRPDMQPARKNLLGRIYERNGEVEKGLNHLYGLLDIAQKEYDSATDNSSFQKRSMRDTLENNIDTLLVRMSQRGFFAQKDKRPLTGYDTNPPFDVGFGAKITVTSPKNLKIQGNWGVLSVGTRIRCILRDAEYPDAIEGGANWDAQLSTSIDPPRERTFMMEQLFVRNQRFDKQIDMSRDPTMYPMIGKDYYLEFYYNPRSAAEHIQDRLGWNGEGMTDKILSNMNTEARPGTKVLFVRIPITRDQLLLRGEWADKPVVIKTPGYRELEGTYGYGGGNVKIAPSE
ncbi:MAG TPA: hypothetical protein VK171_10615 [Fimbriimonas sp.]|nr:hypothetical protein [Fimbriimonas sp.]